MQSNFKITYKTSADNIQVDISADNWEKALWQAEWFANARRYTIISIEQVNA